MKDNIDIRASNKAREGLLKRLRDTRRKLGLPEEGGGDGGSGEGRDGASRESEEALERAVQKAEQSKGKLIQQL